MGKDDIVKLEDLSIQIEEAFGTLQKLMGKISELGEVASSLEEVTKKINEKYLEAFNVKRLEQLRDQNQKALNGLLVDIKKIDESILSIDVMRQQTSESVQKFASRMSGFEETLRQVKASTQEIDSKLLTLLKSAEGQMQDGEKRLQSASRLVEASAEIEKYDKMLKLQQDNNQMLKELMNRLPKGERQTPKREGPLPPKTDKKAPAGKDFPGIPRKQYPFPGK